MAIKNDNVNPSSIAKRDSFMVTVLYLGIIGTNLTINLGSKFIRITDSFSFYSSGFVVSIPNHFMDSSSNVPSSLIVFNASETSCENFCPASSFLNGYAFIS